MGSAIPQPRLRFLGAPNLVSPHGLPASRATPHAVRSSQVFQSPDRAPDAEQPSSQLISTAASSKNSAAGAPRPLCLSNTWTFSWVVVGIITARTGPPAIGVNYHQQDDHREYEKDHDIDPWFQWLSTDSILGGRCFLRDLRWNFFTAFSRFVVHGSQ